MGSSLCSLDKKMTVRGSRDENDHSIRLFEKKLYLAKQSPEPEFDLSECELVALPSGVFSLCKVYRKEVLSLQNNYLKSLDEGGQLANLCLLKVLNLSFNKLQTLTTDIKHLGSLTELYLKNNYIQEIPNEIRHLHQLRILDVSENKLRTLTPFLGELKHLVKLNISKNNELDKLCKELCFASRLQLIELDAHQYIFPSYEVCSQGTSNIMQYLCKHMNIEYISPDCETQNTSQTKITHVTQHVSRLKSCDTDEVAKSLQQEIEIFQKTKKHKEQLLLHVLKDQRKIENEVVKVQVNKEIQKKDLMTMLLKQEKDVEHLIEHFMRSKVSQPEVIQQLINFEKAEHEKLINISRQHYEKIRKTDILKSMENLIEKEYLILNVKENYENNLLNIKDSIILNELKHSNKLNDFLKSRDEAHNLLLQQLLKDQDIQKAVVSSLLEKVDVKTWSLNQEILLLMENLAKLSFIEKEKKELQISYNYNELLQQRVGMMDILEDLLDQRTRRKKQLVATIIDIEKEKNNATDFWLRNYQSLIDSAPKGILDNMNLDPELANCLLQENVIHCLPLIAKTLFSRNAFNEITERTLIESGLLSPTDRDGVLRAVNHFKKLKIKTDSYTESAKSSSQKENSKYDAVVGCEEAKGNESMEPECVVCMDAKCEVVFAPCGHLCCCKDCAHPNMTDCPICRGIIEKVIRVIIV